MNNTLNTITKRFLRGNADNEMIEKLNEYYAIIASFTEEQLDKEICRLISNPEPLIREIGKDLAPVMIHTKKRFSCDRCGCCCSSFRVGISWADIKRYISNKASFILTTITLPDDRVYFQLMTKKEVIHVKPSFSKKNLKKLEMINPSLKNVSDEELENCIFYNPVGHSCMIHSLKPLECKLYPAGNLVFGDEDNACSPDCFESQEVIENNDLARLLDEKRIPDYVLSILFGADRGNGWRLDFFKLALLFERYRMLDSACAD